MRKGRSRSSKVIDFGINRKRTHQVPISDQEQPSSYLGQFQKYCSFVLKTATQLYSKQNLEMFLFD